MIQLYAEFNVVHSPSKHTSLYALSVSLLAVASVNTVLYPPYCQGCTQGHSWLRWGFGRCTGISTAKGLILQA